MLNALETKKYGSQSSNVEVHKLDKITPEPHFVIKTKIFSEYKGSAPGTKLFINVCTHKVVPLPTNPDGTTTEVLDPTVIFPLIMNNKWEIPIITSPNLRDVRDKGGNHCLAIDCLINDKPLRWCMANRDLKMILIQWCFDAVEFRVGGNFLIDRDVLVLPKRTYVGDLEDLEVDIEALNNDSLEVGHLRDSLDKDKPSNLLEATRLDEEENEITDLKTSVDGGIDRDQNSSRRPLIEEIGEPNIKNDASPGDLPVSALPASTEANGVKFTISFRKLQDGDTQGNFNYLLRITSELVSGGSYRLQYDQKKGLLVVSARDRLSTVVDFPLPPGIIGHFATFYLVPDKTVYIFVK